MWANEAQPAYGWWVLGAMFAISAMACEVRTVSASAPSGRQSIPSLSCRLGTTTNRSAFPVRSPYPFAVHCTWVTPASTAETELAIAQPVSSWQWMPRRTPDRSLTSVTISNIPCGSMPPLVSHRTPTDAPASAAATRRLIP